MSDKLHQRLALLAATQDTLVELGKIKEIVDRIRPDDPEDAAMVEVIKTVVDLRGVLLECICGDEVMRASGCMYALANASSAATEQPHPL